MTTFVDIPFGNGPVLIYENDTSFKPLPRHIWNKVASVILNGKVQYGKKQTGRGHGRSPVYSRHRDRKRRF